MDDTTGPMSDNGDVSERLQPRARIVAVLRAEPEPRARAGPTECA